MGYQLPENEDKKNDILGTIYTGEKHRVLNFKRMSTGNRLTSDRARNQSSIVILVQRSVINKKETTKQLVDVVNKCFPLFCLFLFLLKSFI